MNVTMVLFDYEEQSEKKYLIYTEKAGEKLDKLTIGMLSNNSIPGTVPVSFEKTDDSFKIKYDITNLETLQEYLEQVLCRDQILSIFESAAYGMLAAEEYMLEISSYVLDETSVYINPETAELFMIVLPAVCNEKTPDSFLRELLFNIKYDQTENCNYIAALISSLGGDKPFDPKMLIKQIENLKIEVTMQTDIGDSEIKQAYTVSEHMLEENSAYSDDIEESKQENSEESTETIFMDEGDEQNSNPEYILHRISTGEDYVIHENIVRIGRSPSVSEICISGNRKIGRLHAILYVRDGKVYIADNGSKNNTFADGEQIRQGDAPRLLHPGSKLRIANEDLELRIKNKG